MSNKKERSPYSPIVAIWPKAELERLGRIKVDYQQILSIIGTGKGNSKGAIKFEFLESFRLWIPRELCCNLNVRTKEVYIDAAFLKEQIHVDLMLGIRSTD